ncbi:MAG: efflux RND transporter periplasmic adaptor subunit [Rickettsiales bacterium TMED254]|nr:hypothetical protein [Rickettsiales bacterium]RPF76358.1 MAG: efflux RND transporter periplasmic adaptor subunit [Rickettsiales bacterium TMED254]
MNTILKYTILFIISIKMAFTQQATLIEVDKIKFEELNQTVSLIGNIISKKNTKVMSAVSGKIDKLFVEEGDMVKKGQALLNIDYNNYNWLYQIANSNLIKAESVYENSKVETLINTLDLNRMSALKNSSVFNVSKYEKLENNNKILKSKEIISLAELNISKNKQNIAKLNLQKSRVKANFTGFIDRKFVEAGEVVPIGQVLFELVSIEKLEVFAEIPSYRARILEIGQSIKFKTSDNIFYEGKIRSIGAKENSKTRTTKIYIDFNQEKKLRKILINENINLLIPVSQGEKSLTIHKDAILKREGISLAYIVIDNKVQIRPLKLGEAVGNRFIVYDGVKNNEIAVTKGNERLRPGQLVNIKNKENE